LFLHGPVAGPPREQLDGGSLFSCADVENKLMAADWHYTSDGRQLGPVPAAELKQLVANGTVGPDDLLWQIGMPSWVPARDVKGLFPSLLPNDPSVPPPVPSRTSSVTDTTHTPPEDERVAVETTGENSTRVEKPTNIVVSEVRPAVEKIGDFLRSDSVQSRVAAGKKKWQGLTKRQQIATAVGAGVCLLVMVLIVGSVGSSVLGIGGSGGGGFSLPGLSSKPTCEEFLHRIEQLHGWDGWRWVGAKYNETTMRFKGKLGPNSKAYLKQFEGELEPPQHFRMYERHSLHSDAGTGQYDSETFVSKLGVPSDKHRNHADSTEILHYEIWIYKCSDGEIRIPLLHANKKPWGVDEEWIQIIRPVEVFTYSDTFIFEEFKDK